MKTSNTLRSCALLTIAAGLAICGNSTAQSVDTTSTKTTVTTAEPTRPLDHKEEKELRKAEKHEERAERHAAERGDVLPGSAAGVPQAATTTTTTTTTSEGTVNSFAPDQFVIQSATGPLTYHYSKTTQYVDEAGAPVSVEVVKSGAPVSVSYTREGEGYVAQRVIVHTRR